MASISIIDTGYISTSATGTQAPVIVNSGTALVLKNTTVSYDGGSNTDESPVVGSATEPAVGYGSVNAPKISLSIVLDKSNTTDMSYVALLDQLRKTYGIKLLYYNSTTDGYRDITDTLGDVNKDDVHKAGNFSGTATPHLHVRFTSFQITETVSSHMRVELQGVITR
jgi:hypothetical protein